MMQRMDLRSARADVPAVSVDGVMCRNVHHVRSASGMTPRQHCLKTRPATRCKKEDLFRTVLRGMVVASCGSQFRMTQSPVQSAAHKARLSTHRAVQGTATNPVDTHGAGSARAASGDPSTSSPDCTTGARSGARRASSPRRRAGSRWRSAHRAACRWRSPGGARCARRGHRAADDSTCGTRRRRRAAAAARRRAAAKSCAGAARAAGSRWHVDGRTRRRRGGYGRCQFQRQHHRHRRGHRRRCCASTPLGSAVSRARIHGSSTLLSPVCHTAPGRLNPCIVATGRRQRAQTRAGRQQRARARRLRPSARSP